MTEPEMEQPEAEDLPAGLSVDDERPEQPVPLDSGGAAKRTRRENYPYERKMRRGEYEQSKRSQITTSRDPVSFARRRNFSSSICRTLDKPSEREAGQWYW